MKQDRFQIPFFIFIRWVISVNARMFYPFLAVFARGLGVSVADLSLVVMAKYLVAGTTPLLTPLADRRGRKFGMLLGLTLFTSGTALIVFWQQFSGFFLGVGLSSLGGFVFGTSMQSYLGDTVPFKVRGKVVGLIELSWALSFIIGMPLVGILIERGSWVTPFYFILAMGVLVIALVWLLFQHKERIQSEASRKANGFKSVLRSPLARLGILLSLSFSAGNELVNLMFGVWMEDSFGLKVAALGAASAVIGFADLGGELFTAGLLDRLGKKRSIHIGIVLNTLVGLALPWLSFSVWSALTGLFFFYLTFEFTILSILVLLTELLPQARSTFLGINVTAVSVGRALGAVFAPLLYSIGFQFNTFGTLALNMVAIIVLGSITLSEQEEV